MSWLPRRHRRSNVANAGSHEDDAESGRGEVAYSYKTGLVGAPWELRLKPEGLAWQVGAFRGVVRYQNIRRVRLSFRPATLQQHRFLAEIWSTDAPKLKIVSTSWRNLTDQGRQDAEYRAFVVELHRRLQAAGSDIEFLAGAPAFVYYVSILVLAGVAIAFGGMMLRTLSLREWTGAAIISGLFALFAWQLGNYFVRNRPQTYRPDALPEQVLPRG